MAKQLIFSDLSADVTQFKKDLETDLQSKDTWRGNLTTQTSTTLIDFVASLGAFLQQNINYSYQNTFSETATLDDAIRSIAIMSGIRMTRRLPAHVEVSLECASEVTIPPYSQFAIAGYAFFNREAITLTADTPVTAMLYQGTVVSKTVQGTGTALQAFLSDEDGFQVSDEDVVVMVNGTTIPKAYGGLWNYKNSPGCMDLTTREGRLLVSFGNSDFGTIPGINDRVSFIYCTTQGATGNNYITADAQVSLNGFSAITGKALSNPTGGANEKSTLTYKNNTAGSFGTYGSAVTSAQYNAVVNTYPGVIDAICRAQRETDPSDVKMMNVVLVTGITTTPWTAEDIADFCEWAQQQTMYSVRFVWTDAKPVDRNVVMTCYCYNSAVLSQVKTNVENAVRELFEPRPGILLTDLFKSDITTVARNADPSISYIVYEEPVDEMIVTQPASPSITYEILDGQGTLSPYFYSYGITYVNAEGVESTLESWCHPQVQAPNAAIKLLWRDSPSAVTYKLYGRLGENMGLLKTFEAASVTKENGKCTWTDTGDDETDPSQFIRNRLRPIQYNRLASLTVNVEYADRLQRVSTLNPARLSE